ncbi:four helix bundle protein [bacterium]|nr:MAG: four helix bundle protein [bacterium]
MYIAVEDTEVCRRATELSDQIYSLVRRWDYFDRDTVGKQLVRATDSVGAN